MPKETQKAMQVQEGNLELVDVKQEKEIIERITFSTLQTNIKMNIDNLGRNKKQDRKGKIR